jgi:branched-chain amino acid transport system ATP-binding protein
MAPRDCRRNKYTILMVEHNLSVVANLSDIITVLTRGHVLAEGNYADLSKDERVKEAAEGRSPLVVWCA